MGSTNTTQHADEHKQLLFYKLLAYKYADLINSFERKTVGEVKALVNPDDLTIQSIVAEFKPVPYVFSDHYAQALSTAFEFLSKEISYVPLEVELNCWLTPKEILSSKVSDDEDLAIFLCAIMHALGDSNSHVVVAELSNLTPHAFVMTELSNGLTKEFLLLDPCQTHPFNAFLGDKVKVLEAYSFNGNKIKRFLYKFNRSNYEQFLQ
ncbi:MAG: hypothetical protein HY393_04195 [Candidatus Diapherotrites archaeon]|nr:hypothetical protein [Candidatus Diapherotrites archaeon]